MKALLVLLVSFAIAMSASSQKNEPIVINQANHNEEELTKNMYRYPQFVAGNAFFKNGAITESKFNYNYLTNRILFINPRGDTLELANGEDFNKVVIQSDTFYYYNKEFIQQVTHDPKYNLFEKIALRYFGKERKGAYGTYSSTTTVSSMGLWTSNGMPVQLSADENILYNFREHYYVSGRFNQFYPANKKGFYELFPKYQKDIRRFLDKNKINFDKRGDVEKLLEFVRTLEN